MPDDNKPRAEILLGFTSPVVDRPAALPGFFQKTEVIVPHFALCINGQTVITRTFQEYSCRQACIEASNEIGKHMGGRNIQDYHLRNGEWLKYNTQREACRDMESDDVDLFKNTLDGILQD